MLSEETERESGREGKVIKIISDEEGVGKGAGEELGGE